MKKLLRHIPSRWIVPIFVIGGIIAGLGGYTFYMSRAYSYLSDDPSACVNCHIMTPYYQSWNHSSHAQWATCNDCHVPHDNVISKYAFKAKDGLYHAAVFTVNGEPQVIRPREESYEVIMNNCIRCHLELNTEFVKTGMIDYCDTKEGKGKACWDCHTQVPHSKVSNLSASPNAIVPLPASPVPDWLKKKMKNS
ncbi:cytochrome c nitrite reductase small subunit [Dysgonomonas sp. 25]|uniref:cytochrome c nitrite reductase small subunit n=1 Tax=Dysgonomonas sp. 25 TaxID=2302933 RepID=UPI0013D7EC7B|nr:cytochrome c nitrite reductase small subunit [Dysgonomonas sp. 25]NDV69465.1 cytochrome c nitrite reductase small subunit [Dysgonomonas sp. 25]